MKFSVRKRYYGSVDVSYPEGFDPGDDLKTLIRKYQSASFHGMQDLEGLWAGPWHKVFGGAKYVSIQTAR